MPQQIKQRDVASNFRAATLQQFELFNRAHTE